MKRKVNHVGLIKKNFLMSKYFSLTNKTKVLIDNIRLRMDSILELIWHLWYQKFLISFANLIYTHIKYLNRSLNGF